MTPQRANPQACVSASDWRDRRSEVTGPARTMLELHGGFRRASAMLREASAQTVPDWARMRSVFGQLSGVLHSHHHIEEVMLFPRMVAAGVGGVELSREHEQLLAAMDLVRTALGAKKGANDALVGFERLLTDHLDAEEAVAIPYLLENSWL